MHGKIGVLGEVTHLNDTTLVPKIVFFLLVLGKRALSASTFYVIDIPCLQPPIIALRYLVPPIDLPSLIFMVSIV